jgi:hypothetical protein
MASHSNISPGLAEAECGLPGSNTATPEAQLCTAIMLPEAAGGYGDMKGGVHSYTVQIIERSFSQ